ncbi:MAG: hypothetical protein K2N63_08755 [Lachnospiraceae bacterium]|nr:hypothetical protein [Lachnospiraceae bacterium]
MLKKFLFKIAKGSFIGMETMEHNSDLKNAMKQECRLEEELSTTLKDS